ncbi:general glycosylation pathway protein [Pseudoalteromonas sp. BDTF-M6]|uniref:general glycosylation pathway protein n=1 Tax=Pseudoalteromonas sp. BDTF-M6 TaxID=2796132 RepID=UPI001BB08183|nr:general glycosylation pathway protein [Pseudoalteromonas sp. BDTF-M6]MBS3796343.1 general glycosylation pathway protein [Pseudoalteromonas sp. BDTF-M6]
MAMSYLSVIERYREHYADVVPLLESLIHSLVAQSDWPGNVNKAVAQVCRCYGFAELVYVLNAQGIQLSANIQADGHIAPGRGVNRASRPYFIAIADNQSAVVMTEPYISLASGNLCVSVLTSCTLAEHKQGYAVVDVNLVKLIEYIMGDRSRGRFSGAFKVGYSVIVVSLFTLVLVLVYNVGLEIMDLLANLNNVSDPLRPFGIIIFITLALSIFDLGKTILEEEILMHKDIFRHSSTRRTITRFISTILIAVSIEALLTMFKASLGQGEFTIPALLMMLSVIGLLIGLGIYVYLGAKAELMLVEAQQRRSKE